MKFTTLGLGVIAGLAGLVQADTPSIATAWSGLGHDPQHSGISRFAAQPMSRILWTTPVDLNPQYSGNDLFIHYGSPLVTAANTVVIPVKTGASGGFQVEGHRSSDGALLWTQTTDYSLPLHNWVPSCGIALTPKNRLYFPGSGGTVYYRDAPDAATSTTGQIAFYGLANYTADAATFDANVKINTPLTADRYGNIFFGFQVAGATTPALQSGIARIAVDGSGTWISATGATAFPTPADADPSITKVVMNCAPALSNDHKTLYIAVSTGSYGGGWLVALDNRTLAPLGRVALKDPRNAANNAELPDDGTASPTVGPDGDVFFGVLESSLGSNHFRGWLLHFDKTLTQTKTPGAFGWDDTPSVVPAAIVSSYHGTSSYLVLSKYNNYAGIGGNGQNKIAILDPGDTMVDPISGATVMKEVLTILGVTPDSEFPGVPGAVREWCINAAAVDPTTKSAVVNSEDGTVYRWDFTTNTFSQSVVLNAGIGEAYTPSLIGPDGTVYVISNATLYAVGP